MFAPVTKAEFLKVLKKTVTFTVPTEQNLQTFLQQLLVYKDRLYRAIEFLILYEGYEDSQPTCDSKPQEMLRLISDSVPFEFIKNKMDADGNTRKYKDVYDFFKKVSAQSAEFSTAFSGAAVAASERNHQHHLSDTEVKGAQAVTSATKPVATGAVVPYQKWPRRTVVVMETVVVMKRRMARTLIRSTTLILKIQKMTLGKWTPQPGIRSSTLSPLVTSWGWHAFGA
jgi:hypothetical protein